MEVFIWYAWIIFKKKSVILMDALFKQKLAEILEALERIPPTEPLSTETV